MAFLCTERTWGNAGLVDQFEDAKKKISISILRLAKFRKKKEKKRKPPFQAQDFSYHHGKKSVLQ